MDNTLVNQSLSILIASRNRKEILANSLNEISKTILKDCSCIIFDDESDEPYDILYFKDYWKGSLQIIRNSKRKGQAYGRNYLLKECKTKYALMLDDDCFPDNNIASLPKILDTNKDFSIITFQVVLAQNRKIKAWSDNMPNGECRTFLGGASIFKVDDILNIGGYREFFVYGVEEPELAIRLKKNNLKIYYTNKVIILHNHKDIPEENRNYKEYEFLYARNTILLHTLNYSFIYAILVSLPKVTKRLISRPHKYYVLKGIFAGYFDTIKYWNKRTL